VSGPTHTDPALRGLELAGVFGPEPEPELDARVAERTAELRRVNQALRESEERWRTLVDNTPDLIFSLDPRGRFSAVNRSTCAALGRREDEILGKTHVDLGFPADVVAEWRALHERALAGEVVRAETHMPLPDGRTGTYDLMLVPVRDGGGAVAGVRGVSRDLTDRKRLEEQLRHAQKLEAVGRLAGGVAHDFNNIIQAIQGFAALVLDELRPEDPMHADVCEIVRASGRAAALTKQLLAFSRKSIIQLRSLDAGAVIADMQKMLGRIVGEDVEIAIHCGQDLWPIRADVSQLEQALANLVVNARDAMPQGGHLVIETSNVVLGEELGARRPEVKPGPYVMVAIRDDGCGMPPEVQEHLFEPFFTTKRDGRGTGLGLATVYGIVSQMGGFVWVHSEPGRGTTFKLYFPRAESAHGEPAHPPRHELPRSVARRTTVLLVEDDASLRRSCRRMLERHGLRVVEAANGGEALLHLRGGVAVDVVLTDVVMPLMSGRQLVEEIHKLRAGLPAVFMSGYTDEAVLRHGVLEASTLFVQKPFAVEELLSKLALALCPGLAERRSAAAPER
jgi:PAS domain S-box-containing protein